MVETTGRGCPAGQIDRKPNCPLGTSVTFKATAVAFEGIEQVPNVNSREESLGRMLVFRVSTARQGVMGTKCEPLLGAGSMVRDTVFEASPPVPFRTRTAYDPAESVAEKVNCVDDLEEGVTTLPPTSTTAVEALKFEPFTVNVFVPAVAGFGVTDETTGADGAGLLTASVSVPDAAPPLPLRTSNVCVPAASVAENTNCVAVLEVGTITLDPISTCAASVLKFAPVTVKVLAPDVAGFGVTPVMAGPLTVSDTVFDAGPAEPLRTSTL
jgi:hypothetical protein